MTVTVRISDQNMKDSTPMISSACVPVVVKLARLALSA